MASPYAASACSARPARGVPGAHRRRRPARAVRGCVVTATTRAPVVGTQPAASVRRPGVRRICRVELAALLTRPRTQLAVLTCLLAPLAFAVAMGVVDTVPSDTLFGRWVKDSGMAAPLVVLGFAGQWGIPALVSLVAGDVFAGEDRRGTWPTLVTRSTPRSRVFAAKTVAATGVGVLLVLLLGSSSVACGAAPRPSRPARGPVRPASRRGRSHRPGRAGVADPLLPALAFAALAVTLSVLTRSTAAGTGGPVAIGLLTSLAGMTGLPEWLRELLPGAGFETWHGLLAQPVFTGPLLRTSAVSVAGPPCAWPRRGGRFPPGREEQLMRTARWPLALATIAVTSTLSGCGTSADHTQVARAVGPAFARLYALQQQERGRTVDPHKSAPPPSAGAAARPGPAAGRGTTGDVPSPTGRGARRPGRGDVLAPGQTQRLLHRRRR